MKPRRLGLKHSMAPCWDSPESGFLLFHVAFFSRLTVHTCFVLAAFVTGLQRAVSGCVTANCNGWTLQAARKNPCSLHILTSFSSHVCKNTCFQRGWLARNQLLVWRTDSLFYVILLISHNTQRILTAKTFQFRYWAQDTVCSQTWSINVQQ